MMKNETKTKYPTVEDYENEGIMLSDRDASIITNKGTLSVVINRLCDAKYDYFEVLGSVLEILTDRFNDDCKNRDEDSLEVPFNWV